MLYWILYLVLLYLFIGFANFAFVQNDDRWTDKLFKWYKYVPMWIRTVKLWFY